MASLRPEQNVQFILLAEFDIDQGSVLSHQYPFPTGTDEQQLAELMLPDGVHHRPEDWTTFLLNQSPENSIATPFHESDEPASETNGAKEDKKELLYVLNLVRTKHDQKVRRGALCKALAVCTHLPYIQIFKAAIVCALDNYFTEQSVDCLVRLFDSLNAMDISLVPTFTRHEKFILRTSDRRDLFVEKFAKRVPFEASRPESRNTGHHSDDSAKRKLGGSTSSELVVVEQPNNHARSASTASLPSSDPSMESTVVVGDEPPRESMENGKPLPNKPHEPPGKQDGYLNGLSTDSLPERRSFTKPVHRDTRVFEAQVKYGELNLPIKLPLTTFSEEIGDFSLIELIQTFSAPNVTVTGPLHPHLHTNGPQTHPVIILFNALITHKRVMFLGFKKPAGYVCNFVLAACALASGSGCHLRGFTERAFPYVGLLTKKVLDPFQKSGYIAGVLNPIFENIQIWDVLCDIDKGSITINTGLASPEPTTSLFPVPPALVPRTGVLKSEGGAEDEFGRLSSTGGRDTAVTLNSQGLSKNDFASRTDSYDAQFMEDILASISYHAGEAQIRARFAEYVYRFIQLASRYEEDTQGSTSIGHPCQPFKISPKTREASLGSGIRFSDEITGMREIGANAGRIEGWRKSASYEYWATDFHLDTETSPIQGFDVMHQVLRLRNGKNVPDEEIRLILRTFTEKVSTYDQVVEFLSYFPPQYGGLQPLAMTLFHQQPDIRDLAVEFLSVLREYPIGFASLQSLNQFHRYAYIRLAYEREQQQWRDAHPLYNTDPPLSFNEREDRSNESE